MWTPEKIKDALNPAFDRTEKMLRREEARRRFEEFWRRQMDKKVFCERCGWEGREDEYEAHMIDFHYEPKGQLGALMEEMQREVDKGDY